MGFGKDFAFGAATAAFQIEGAWDEDGRGRCVWDDYSHTPGKVFGNHNGDTACDHYHRWREDVALMARYGIPNYRFSVAWPRVMPAGKGAVNEKGFDFYSRLVDELLLNGITPWMTLFHWDYPTALEDLGGWRNPDSVKWFADYTDIVTRRLGDRVKKYITFNEPQCFLGLGYAVGAMAPGVQLPLEATVPMCHRVLLSHGAAADVIRQNVADAEVGYAPCGGPSIPASPDPADVEAARKAYFDIADVSRYIMSVAWWSDPAVLGVYPEKALKQLEKYLPRGWEEDMPRIARPLDFYCQNIYYGSRVRHADNERGYEILEPKVGQTKTACQWMTEPESLYWGPRFLYERYRVPFVISENGMSCHDAVSLDGKVHDPNRQDYMHRYLLQFRRAAEDGVDARGYFAWSLLDNFEWNSGYNERFGLVYVDYATQERVPKDSLEWYSGVIRSRGEDL